jgi:tetratricopeptide (TPR) repeat protein
VSDALELRISVPKETFVQGEPVPIRVEIRNRSEEALELIPMFEPQYIYSSLRFRVTDPEGETWTAEPSRQASIGWSIRLNPGDRLTHTVLLHFGVVRGAGRFVFRDTGKYAVEARYYDVASSEPIGITIVEPKDLEIQARRLFTQEQGELTIELGATQGAVDSFRQIIREYPTSIFAPYASYYLGMHYQRRREYKQSIELLEGILTDHKHFPLWADVMYQLAVAYRETGRKEKARESISQLVSKAPSHVAARRGKELLRELESD